MSDSRSTVLIVDDDRDFLETMTAVLTSRNYRVITAVDGREALERVRLHDPDLIILDIMMDSMYEGFSVLATLRGTPEYIDYRDIPIIMASAVKRDYGKRFSLPDSGVDLTGDIYLDKPFKPQILLEKVAELLHA